MLVLFRRSALLFLAIFVCSALALAQTAASTGAIQVTALDPSGAAIAGAQVQVTSVATGLQSSAVTNPSGIGRVLLLQPGSYSLLVVASGFAQVSEQTVLVNVGRITPVIVTMAMAAAKEVVYVSPQDLQTAEDYSGAMVAQSYIQKLPINGRRFQDFVTLTPGAFVESSRQGISISGQRGILTSYNIDGLNYNDPFFGGIRGAERSNFYPTIPQEAVQEFQVVPSGYSSEFTGSTGGVVTATTKSGGNALHGSLFFYDRPQQTAASNEYFDTISKGFPAGTSVNTGPTQQQWGGSIGGPILRDKLFYFGAYEQQRWNAQQAVLFSLPSASSVTPSQLEAFNFLQGLQVPFTATNNAVLGLVRIDYQALTNTRVNFRYNESRNRALNSESTGTFITPTTTSALSNNGTERDRTQTAAIQGVTTFGAYKANELRLEYSREVRPRSSNSSSPSVLTSIGDNTFANYGAVSFLPSIAIDSNLQAADNFSWNHGRHTWKFGAEYNHLFASQLFGFNQFGHFDVTATSGDQILEDLGNRFNNADTEYFLQLGNLQADIPVNLGGAFVQDTWNLRPNFTLNYGLRWEGQFNPTPPSNNTALVGLIKGVTFPNGLSADPTNISSDPNEFMPRVGFAWDPWSDGKTVVRGFGGVFYGSTPLLLMAAPMNNFRLPPGDLSIGLPFDTTGTLCAADTTVFQQLSLIGINLNNYSLGNLPVLTPAQVESIASICGISNNPFFGARPTLMAKGFANPRSTQAGFGIEHQFLRNLVGGLDFNWIKTVHLERNRNYNLPLPIIRPLSVDPAQRPFYGTPRPIPSLGKILVRESEANSLYRSMTVRAAYHARHAQFQAFYMLSENLSNDDNERDAGAISYADSFNLGPEYGFSNLDHHHQFTASSIFYLPFGIELATDGRFLSGPPFDASVGFDANKDHGGIDRPFSAPGVPFRRNIFRNEPIRVVDLRVAKNFRVTEGSQLGLTVDMFNVFNAMDLQLNDPNSVDYCFFPTGASKLLKNSCGLQGQTNADFGSLRDNYRFDPITGAPNPDYGAILPGNSPNVGITPFQAQMGVKFQF